MILIKPIPSVILASPIFKDTQHGMWELTANRDIFKTLKNCIDCLHEILSAVYLCRTPESFISILEAFQIQMYVTEIEFYPVRKWCHIRPI